MTSPKFNVLAKFQTYPSATEGSCVEINHFDVLLQSQYVIGASGDAFGAYKWNIETQQLMATYPTSLPPLEGCQPYLHSIKTLHSNCQMNDDKLVLMGGEGGLLTLWDGQQDACVEKWNLNSGCGSTTKTKLSHTYDGSWISSIETLSNDGWWIVGGGSPVSQSTSPNPSGFWCTFHGPTRSRIMIKSANQGKPYPSQNSLQHQQQSTHAPITKIMAAGDSDSLDLATQWYSVGWEGVVRQWSLSSCYSMPDTHPNTKVINQLNASNTNVADPPRAVWCDLPCANTVACWNSSHNNTGSSTTTIENSLVAVAGVGSTINIYQDHAGVLVPDQSVRF
jgi:hypothetical protein